MQQLISVLTAEHNIRGVLILLLAFFVYRSLILHHELKRLKQRIYELTRLLDKKKPS